MKAEEIAPIAMPTSKTMDPKPNRHYTTSKQDQGDASPNINADTVSSQTQDRIQLSHLEKLNAESQEVAVDIRKVNQSMEVIGSHLSDMQTTLDQLVKIYPPYPPESTERIEALRQFNALRNMIDQLTLPDQTGGMHSIISKEDGSASEQDIHITMGDQEIRFRRQPVHTGQNGLNIPELSDTASDREISQALSQTIAAQKMLQSKRQNFINEANRILSQLS